jgi:phospholipase/carboxylesterase
MTDIHQGQLVRTAGDALNEAKAAMVMVHGRGATAESILSLVPEIHQPGFAYLAPQAAGNTWYPNRFLEPIASNEPYLSSALAAVAAVMTSIQQSGIPSERIVLLGFSQGACLTLEFAARNAQRYGGLIGLSGGLIGPDDTPRDYPGSLDKTPVFLGCSEVDFHVPKARVDESAAIFRKLGGEVIEKLYPNMGHTTNEDELRVVREIMANVVK